MKYIAIGAYFIRACGLFCLLLGGLAGCASLQPAARPVLYDFGLSTLPGQAVHAPAKLPAVALSVVESGSALESTAMWYRLAYADAQQLRAYTQARWTAPPAELLRLRLRDRWGPARVVLQGTQAGAALVLHVELEEFSQVFDAVDRSSGLLQLRATLSLPGGAVVGQRSFVAQRTSASADASGGVRALAAAADAVIADMDLWLQQTPVPPPAAR